MTLKSFMECALADFLAYRSARKLNQFKAFVESLKSGASPSDLPAINSLLEGTNVLLEYRLKPSDRFIVNTRTPYNSALKANDVDGVAGIKHALATELNNIDIAHKESMATKPKEVKYDEDGIEIPATDEVIDNKSAFTYKVEILRKFISDARNKLASGEYNQETFKSLTDDFRFIFIGSVTPFMMNTVNKLAQSADEQGATSIFMSYLELIIGEIDQVIAGKSDQIYFRPATNRELVAAANKVVTLSHVKYNDRGREVRIWDWAKKAGSKDLNNPALRAGRVNAQAIRYKNVYYTRTGGNIPENLLNVPPADDSVSEYWKEIKLYSNPTASDGVAYSDDDGNSKSHMDIALDKQAMDNIDPTDYLNPLHSTAPHGYDRDTDTGTDFNQVADDIIGSMFSDDEVTLQEIIQTAKKPADVESAKSKLAKLQKFREGFLAKIKARRANAEISARKQQNLARVNNKSFADLKKMLVALTDKNEQILRQLNSLSDSSASLTIMPDSDDDVTNLRDVTAMIIDLKNEYADNEETIADINARLQDENTPDIVETETAAVKRVMGNAQTLDNNMADIKDNLYAELNKAGYNISPELYKKYAGDKDMVYTPSDRKVFSELASKLEMPLKKVIDAAREQKTNPRNHDSVKKLMRVLVDMD